ncbi:hypothetical protein M0R89_04640 [Halorussus limi]|uniref:DUF7998 domain-containing protein n=1 Tax=Halorussus limi TaxID=2938695 RepID=A0A8U0HXI5_9EURY|nr:hypothetical protein [Halorussus limi]UPV75356.1 hypothetical protein M0R89_04640 [Halorussus limi]
MPGIPRPFAGDDADEETFDEYDEFRPDHLPDPGQFLRGADVLTGEEHCAFHRLTRDIFEERGVYDATFGYNLARLNLDSRHPDAGWRYARAPDGDGADEDVLLAEFTPTTEFCPQSDTLTVGAFRAWNGLSDRHGFDRVSVAVAPIHHESTDINEKLRNMERRLDDDGTVESPERSRESGERSRGPADDADSSSLPF